MPRRRDTGDDRWSIAFAATAVAVALTTVMCLQWDVGASVGDWFVTSAPFARNALLATVTVGPATLTLIALRRLRRDAGAQQELTRRSNHDTLTGLPNRDMLDRTVRRGARTTKDGTSQCAVLFCDLDRFKLVNDTYGHEVGDRLMEAVGNRIAGLLGDQQWALRYGGDEFVVVAGDLRGPMDGVRLANRLVRALEAPFELGIDTVRISASVGLTLTDRSGTEPSDLLRDADLAMYAAKLEGRGPVCLFERSMRGRLSRATVATQLAAAVDAGELQLRYEPVLSVLDGALVAVRAELHWDSEEHPDLSTRELVAGLEETGLIVRAGAWAIAEACRHAGRWNELAAGAPAVQVLVPVSPRLLARASFRDQVARALGTTGARRNQLCLVVGDRSLASDITDAWTMLRHVRTLGVQVMLDGFGAGTSALADLREARLDQLCVDSSLIAGLDHGVEDAAIVEHVVALAHRLTITVTASAVTNAAQLAVLRRVGCDRATGPFLGQPLLPEDIDLLLARAPAKVTPARDAQMPLPRMRAFGADGGGPADV